MNRRHAAAAVMALAGFVCAPCVANAAELSGDPGGEIFYVASSGERNDVQVGMSGDRLVITDAGAAIVTPAISTDDDGPSNQCVADSANSASCALPRNSKGRLSGRVQIILADGDDTGTVSTLGEAVRLTASGLEGNDRLTGPGLGKDRLVGSGSRPFLDGGAGDDTLKGSYISGDEGNDTLTGTNRGDVLSGGPGDDVLSGAAGDDSLGDGEGADALRGGPGTDELGPSVEPVSISTDGRANDGEAGEGDNVGRDIESFSGTDGEDRFDVKDGNKSSVQCGDADDVVVGDPIDDAFRDCERVTGARVGAPRPVAISVFRFTYANRAGTNALARVSCHTDRTETCAGVLTLRSLRGVVLATGAFRVTRRGSPRVDLELTKAGSALVDRERRVDARASATMRINRSSVPRAFAGDTIILAHGCKREEGCS